LGLQNYALFVKLQIFLSRFKYKDVFLYK